MSPTDELPRDMLVRVTEVGPRDGLQNEDRTLTIEQRVRFIKLLALAEPAEIEVASFVSPKWVPQMADAAELAARLDPSDDVLYSALVPNERGLDAALESGVGKIAVFTAASETFSQRNTNATIDESLARLAPVIRRARDLGLPVRGYVSCVVACPYDGPIDPLVVRDVSARLLGLGITELDLGETIGVAAPLDIDRLYDGLEDLVSPGETTLHLHDTRGTALACAMRALQLGVRSFDGSCGGLGGCPFAPGAAGNLATEDLAYMLERMGITPGLDLDAQFDAARYIEGVLGRPLTGRVYAVDGRSAPAPGSGAGGVAGSRA
ncbi:MAG: hydroxymethylglutaryl-CoA lyase [Planctomycetota bacterium]